MNVRPHRFSLAGFFDHWELRIKRAGGSAKAKTGET